MGCSPNIAHHCGAAGSARLISQVPIDAESMLEVAARQEMTAIT